MRHRFRRDAAVAAAFVLLVALAGCGDDDGGTGAAEPSPTPPATALAAAAWLETQLGAGGLVHNDQYDIDDHGLSLDFLFALNDLGTGEDSVAAILAALRKDPAAYTDAFGTESAGSTGKLAAAVEVAGADDEVTDFGGVDLAAKLEGLVRPGTGPQGGRGVDKGGADYSNTIGQTWVVRGLAGADSDLTDPAAEFLLGQQCAAGFFRDTMDRSAPGDFTCDGAPPAEQVGSVDATAFAVVALEEAAEQGVDVGDATESAGGWLEGQQAADGSFAADGVPNANSTAVAATALALLGRDDAAARAAEWLAPLQVTEESAEGSRLADETGAVAYDAAALARAKRTGITVKLRDQWRRATAQAAPGLAAAELGGSG
jgi:hypothetical protein